MRWVAAAWMVVWAPAYAMTWGWSNFILLCDIAVILTCVGLWRGSALLLSSQAVASILVNLLWTVDMASRLAFGRHLIGGTEYMLDDRFPLWVRLLSVFHVVWPVLLVWALRHTGYDRRGFAFQSILSVGMMIASRFVDPAKNANAAFRDPLFHREWGPAPVHLAVILAALICVIYWPTHRILMRTLPPAKVQEDSSRV
jgi:hypothetical protein